MADVIQNASSEFWQAPVTAASAPNAQPELAEVCPGCSSEFVVGAGFCHVCGVCRSKTASVAQTGQRWLAFARHLQFHHIKEHVGLPTSALVAFLLGVGCALAALLVSFVFSAGTTSDWQAVQIWRIQWLLASAASFLSGILLNRK
jgi:hypothetical protein